MPIERITADDLRDMEHQEGLVLQGCGGEAQEWLDGINDLLTQDGILQNGSRFETVRVFQHDGLTNLLFPFEDIQVDMGKLAMWRLQTHGAFGGTWLSDYVPNRLGGFRSARQENPRPLCPLLGQDGNIFHLMGIAAEFSGRMAWRQKQRKCRPASWAERATATRKHWESSANMWKRSCLRPAKIERKRRRSMSMSDNQRWSILQGDALKVLGTFAPNTFDAVITDPPYASGGRTQAEKNKSTARKYSSMGENAPPPFDGDAKDQRSWTRWAAEWLYEARKVCKSGAPVCMFIDWRQLPAATDALQWAGWIWRGTAVWDKGNSRPQKGRFRQQAEYIVWGSNGDMPISRPVPCLPGVFKYGNPQSRIHLTEKPLQLMRDIVKITEPGGHILDPFAGSGTTVLAAVQEGYTATGIEVTDTYAELARERIRKELACAA